MGLMPEGEKKALLRMQHGHEANKRMNEAGGCHDELAGIAVELESNPTLTREEKAKLEKQLQAANWPGYEWISLADASKQTGREKEELLRMAQRGTIQAFVKLQPFKAQLQALPCVENKRQGGRECKGGNFPIAEHTVGAFVTFKKVNIDFFPATALDEDIGHPLQDHNYFLEVPQTVTRKQVYFRGSDVARWVNSKSVSDECRDVFGSMDKLTANEVTIRLMKKDGESLFDRVKISAREREQTFSCNKIGLASDKSGVLNRAGKMLLALEKGRLPANIKAPEKAMTELRKIIKGLGVTDQDPFHPRKVGWRPKFTLKDQIEEADKRAKKRAFHMPYKEELEYDDEKDEAGEWLSEHDE